MKNRFLIAMLLAFLMLFLLKMNSQEEIIKTHLYCDVSWISFSDACQSIQADTVRINKAIETLVFNDVTDTAKKLLYIDFAFMICVYPLLYLLLMQLTTLYDKTKQDKLIVSITIIAFCQLLSLIADISENIILLQSIEKLHLVVSDTTIRSIEIVKWSFPSIAVAVFLIASLIWIIGFVRETEKASADVNY
jgi:hypothetical protein